ncbi:MAG TPA: DUF1559 domain-containing protein [Pirellulales bacterium]|nr:DUF1559 domain-containing protein [Pirellulales bacterium]
MLHDQRFVTDRSSSRAWPTALLMVLALIGLGVSGLRGPLGPARAAEPPAEGESAEGAGASVDGPLLPAFDGSYLPEDTVAVVSVKPLRVAKSDVVVEPTLLSFPMLFGFGFATADKDQAPEWDKLREWEVEEVKTIVLSTSPNQAASSELPDPKDPPLLEIYRMRRPYERTKLRVKLFGELPDGVTETTCHGHPCFRARSDHSGYLVNYLMVDDRTIVILRDRDVARLLAADPQSHPSWYSQWQEVAGSPLAVGFDTAALDALEERAADSAEQVFWSALKNTSQFFGRVASTADGLEISATAVCKSSDQAVATCQAAKGGLATAAVAVPQILLPSMLPKEYQMLDVVGSLAHAFSHLEIDVMEARVHLEASLDADFVARLADATKTFRSRTSEECETREKQDEQAHIAKLGRIAKALNDYHAEHGHYPPAAAAGPDGKTLHSWRVELLPYLGERKLFDEYKLDEPWDGEHNKPLVGKIPTIYSTSQFSEKGHADYFVVTGQGTLFDADAPISRESITDAPGETILVLQSRQPVPWTKPVDVETTPDHAVMRPFRGPGKGFYAAFADGTVKVVPKGTDAATIRAMFTKAGGDEVKLR